MLKIIIFDIVQVGTTAAFSICSRSKVLQLAHVVLPKQPEVLVLQIFVAVVRQVQVVVLLGVAESFGNISDVVRPGSQILLVDVLHHSVVNGWR